MTEVSTLSGLPIRSVSGRGPNSDRWWSGEPFHRAARENCWLVFPPAVVWPFDLTGWQALRPAVVFVRSTIPKDPRSVSDRTFRLQFPEDFGLTSQLRFPGLSGLVSDLGFPISRT